MKVGASKPPLDQRIAQLWQEMLGNNQDNVDLNKENEEALPIPESRNTGQSLDSVIRNIEAELQNPWSNDN